LLGFLIPKDGGNMWHQTFNFLLLFFHDLFTVSHLKKWQGNFIWIYIFGVTWFASGTVTEEWYWVDSCMIPGRLRTWGCEGVIYVVGSWCCSRILSKSKMNLEIVI
jgi:hypothetical protein